MLDRFGRLLIVACPFVLACGKTVEATGDGTGGAGGAAYGGSGGAGANAATGGGGSLGGAANDASPEATVLDAPADATVEATDVELIDAADGSTDDVARDVTCAELPVWTETSSSFVFSRSVGGLLPRFVYIWTFSKTGKTLLYSEGYFFGEDPPPLYLVHLSNAQFDAIVAQVSSIRTVCKPDILTGAGQSWKLAVSAPGADASALAVWTGVGLPAPYMGVSAATDLTSTLTHITDASCTSDAGGGDGGDAGVCDHLEGDASADAAVTDAADGG